MWKKFAIKLCFFLGLIFITSIFLNTNVLAYGEKIEGYQTHYEIQNQYISGDNLVIEGFYYIYELQNFTDNTKGLGSHYYYLELFNESKRYTYSDAGGYYIDLTDVEYKTGYPWASVNENDIVYPRQAAFNYRYRDIGFQFIIPFTDLKNFHGESSIWNMNVSCVATNTYKGKGVAYEFKQKNIYASKAFGELTYQDYKIKSNSELYNLSSDIYADVAYIRTGPGKSSGIAGYNGKRLYWAEGHNFYDLSQNTTVSTGNDKLTWYRLQYGNIFHDGVRYRASYESGGYTGWIPSIFLGSIQGTPYTITIHNSPPVITADDLKFNEGTNITEEILLNNVTVYDYSFGTKKPIISSTNLTINSSKNKVGNYYLTYYSIDSNLLETKRTISVTIENVKPQIKASDKELNYSEILTEDFLLKEVSAYDVGDGNLTDKILIHDIGHLVLDTNTNKHGLYQITYSVTDSNNEETRLTINLKIIFRYIRAIDKYSLNTLAEKSKWRAPGLHEKIVISLNKNDNEYKQIWRFSNEDRINIQDYMRNNVLSEDTSKWFLTNYKRCRLNL